jgi:hypothetical protein
MNILAAYRELICSPAQLAQCQQAATVEQFLQQLKSLWRQETLTDDQLLSELAACNQQIHDVELTALNAHWLPYRYQKKVRSIDWCLPLGHATEPFHDQYIERCRGQLLNQLITPKTSLEPLMDGQIITAPLEPAGFIFHLSRCGSTLVSGCLAESDNTCVLSESPLLTELMLDDSLNEKIKQHLLPQFIHMQAMTSPGRRKIIIKWNAWDIFFWSQIRALYPRVPVLFLVRNPVEILASHQRSAGRHMAGDQSLMVIQPIRDIANYTSLGEFREGVLQSLLDAMNTYKNSSGVWTVDYASLTVSKMFEVAEYFSLGIGDDTRTRIATRMNFHSKTPDQPFQSDGQNKRDFYRSHEFPMPGEEVLSLYRNLAYVDSLSLAGLC